MKNDKKDLVTTENKEIDAVHPLQKMVDEATAERKILTAYITEHMVKGTDYAPIHISKTCQNKYTCTNKYHFSKDNLTKAGAEKIKDLLKLYPDFKKDTDTWEMAGAKPGLFCYRCVLITQDGKPAGVGLGACDASEKSGNMNNAIKIAKKRAFVDAILTTGSLSDFFTQDLEDMMHEDKPLTTKEMGQEKEQAALPLADEAVSSPKMINAYQKGRILELLKEKGYPVKGLNVTVENNYGVPTYEDLDNNQAAEVILNLQAVKGKKIKQDEKEKEDKKFEEDLAEEADKFMTVN